MNELKRRLRSYNFGIIDSRNIPPEIKLERLITNDFKMSAAEIWTFLGLFGVIIGDLIPENDPSWQSYLSLRQILAVVTFTSMQKECNILLRGLIHEHHRIARDVLKRNLSGKDHICIQSPSNMHLCGPTVNFLSMRFEAKYKKPINTVVFPSSSRNLCKTIAIMTQMK